jgi:hypothetical protein
MVTALPGRGLPVARLVLLLLWACSATAIAATDNGPLPPCGQPPYPAYPDKINQLQINFWSEDQLAKPWQPPDCSGWQPAKFSLLMAASGRFIAVDGANSILQRIGAVSSLAGLRYWSVSRDRWTTLVEQAYALDSPDESTRRDDFSLAELNSGREFFYWQHEPTTSGSAIYVFRIVASTPQRIVMRVHNASNVRHLGLNMLDAGGAETLYVFEHLLTSSDGKQQWGYYQLTRMGHGLHDWLPVGQASYANRMTSVFRFFTGLDEAELPVWKD